MPRGENTPEETRAEIARRAQAGQSIRSIARELGLSVATAGRYAKGQADEHRNGLAKANVAKRIDLEAARLDLLEKLVRGSVRAAERMTEPYQVYSFTPAGAFVDKALDEPPAPELRNLATTAAIGADKVRDYLAAKSDPSLEAAKSLAAKLSEGFAEFASNTGAAPAQSNTGATPE